jgi:hypothetical protein
MEAAIEKLKNMTPEEWAAYEKEYDKKVERGEFTWGETIRYAKDPEGVWAEGEFIKAMSLIRAEIMLTGSEAKSDFKLVREYIMPVFESYRKSEAYISSSDRSGLITQEEMDALLAPDVITSEDIKALDELKNVKFSHDLDYEELHFLDDEPDIVPAEVAKQLEEIGEIVDLGNLDDLTMFEMIYKEDEPKKEKEPHFDGEDAWQ